MSSSTSSSTVKIFRPWVSSSSSVTDDEEVAAEELANEIRNASAFTRVPEPGHSAAEFSAIYENAWNGAPICLDDWAGSLQMLPFQTPENLAQSLSYLDPAYLNMAFPEIYANAKITKLKQRPKKFRCPHCKVSFSNNGQLKGHVRIHTGERPFKCDSEKCGKSFTRNEELTRHKRIHTGLRPFPCDQCGKRFGRKDHLKKHIRTHYPQPRFLDANFVPLYPVLFGY